MKILTGPCVLEDRDTVMRIAEKLKPLSEDKRVDFYFKASFDKTIEQVLVLLEDQDLKRD